MILNLLDRMKLPFRKNKEFLSALYDILGFYPHNIEIYRIAFAHKSLSYRRDNKDRKGKDRKPRTENTSKPLNNERLEYLGDAVLETVVSDILFRHFEHKREGFLTSTRSKIVQREALNRLANEMGLEKLIQAAQGTRVDHTNIGGNAFEALMGAIYLDRGFQHCHWFIANRIIGHYVDLDSVAQKEVNFKSKLLEWSQKNRINTKFNDTANDDNEKGFQSVIIMEGITIGRGSGRSKKESQQAASKEALTRMRRDPKVYDSIFRAKEKRTAMEAEESFALPKIDEIENSLNKGNDRNAGKKAQNGPVLEAKDSNRKLSTSDAAYDLAYDENAKYDVIDTPPAEPQLTAADYEAKGLPAPPEENELNTVEDKATKRRNRNRAPKTVNDAVKGFKGNKAKTAEANDSKAPESKEPEQTPKNNEAAKGNKAKAAPKDSKKEEVNQAAQTAQKVSSKTMAEPAAADQTSAESAPQDVQTVCDEKPEIDHSPLQTLQAKIILDDEPEVKTINASLFDEELIVPDASQDRSMPSEPVVETATVAEPVEKTEELSDSSTEAAASVEKEDDDNPEFIITQDLVPVEKKEEDAANATDAENAAVDAVTPTEATETAALPDKDAQPETGEAETTEEQKAEPSVEEKPAAKEISFEEKEIKTEDEDEDEVETEKAESTVTDSATRPMLRHLTLDDFVFGMDQQEFDKFEEEDNEAEPAPQKPKKTHRRRRRPAKPADADNAKAQKNEPKKKAETGNQSKPNPKKEQTANQPTDANKDEAPKAKSRRRRRRPAKKAEE